MYDYYKALAVVDGCFFPKDKLNYSWMIPGVNYFSHVLVINRKIIFLSMAKIMFSVQKYLFSLCGFK